MGFARADRPVLTCRQNRDESMQGEPSLRKQLYDEMLKLSFPKADKSQSLLRWRLFPRLIARR